MSIKPPYQPFTGALVMIFHRLLPRAANHATILACASFLIVDAVPGLCIEPKHFAVHHYHEMQSSTQTTPSVTEMVRTAHGLVRPRLLPVKALEVSVCLNLTMTCAVPSLQTLSLTMTQTVSGSAIQALPVTQLCNSIIRLMETFDVMSVAHVQKDSTKQKHAHRRPRQYARPVARVALGRHQVVGVLVNKIEPAWPKSVTLHSVGLL